MSIVASKFDIIQARIARAAEESGRSSGDVTLIAVSKTMPVELINEAHKVGLRHFGENRVQEALMKFAPRAMDREQSLHYLVAREGIPLHMIGGLQRNKAQSAARLFDMVHSVDRIELIDALEVGVERARVSNNTANSLALPVLIEVNITGESGKSGATPKDVQRLAERISACDNLKGVGLMTIARQGATEPEAGHTFSQLRVLLEGLQISYSNAWCHLSMGMSDDYEPAIREGATMVRLGRALFGDRSP